MFGPSIRTSWNHPHRLATGRLGAVRIAISNIGWLLIPHRPPGNPPSHPVTPLTLRTSWSPKDHQGASPLPSPLPSHSSPLVAFVAASTELPSSLPSAPSPSLPPPPSHCDGHHGALKIAAICNHQRTNSCTVEPISSISVTRRINRAKAGKGSCTVRFINSGAEG